MFVDLHCHSFAAPSGAGIVVREWFRLDLGDFRKLQVLVLSLVWKGFLPCVKLHKLLIFVVALKVLLGLVDLFKFNVGQAELLFDFVFVSARVEQEVKMFYQCLSGCFCLMMQAPFLFD